MTALAAISGVAAQRAEAMSAPIHITQDVNLRSGPSTSYARVGGLYRGTSPDFVCWTQGQNINGVDVWFRVNSGGVSGYYASFYDDSSYRTDADITPKYGIPRCGAQAPQPAPAPPPAPAPVPAAQTAINWARPFADGHDRSFNGLCLTFVFRAYEAVGVNLRPWVNVPIGSNTYPQDIWGHFTHGVTGSGTPPAGALVFFASKTNARTLSHVALSLGGGSLISTSDRVAGYTHYETVSQHSYGRYVGWWLPV